MKRAGFFALMSLIICPSAWAQCQLSPQDFVSLRQSPSKIQNQAQVDALPADRRARLCKTRANYAKYHRQGGGLQTTGDLAYFYLSPSENKEFSKWLDVLLEKELLGGKRK